MIDNGNTVFVVLDTIRVDEYQYITEFSGIYSNEEKAKANSSSTSRIIEFVVK